MNDTSVLEDDGCPAYTVREEKSIVLSSFDLAVMLPTALNCCPGVMPSCLGANGLWTETSTNSNIN